MGFRVQGSGLRCKGLQIKDQGVDFCGGLNLGVLGFGVEVWAA